MPNKKKLAEAIEDIKGLSDYASETYDTGETDKSIALSLLAINKALITLLENLQDK